MLDHLHLKAMAVQCSHHLRLLTMVVHGRESQSFCSLATCKSPENSFWVNSFWKEGRKKHGGAGNGSGSKRGKQVRNASSL